MTRTLRFSLAAAILVATAGSCHRDAKPGGPGTSGDKCQHDLTCAAGHLCHPTRGVCLPTYPDQKLLDAAYDLKGCELANVYFSFDGADLTEETKGWMDYNVRCIKAHGGKELALEGYADARGEPGYNLDLSGRRAAAVKQHLEQNGVSSTVEIVSKGEANPITTGTTEQDHAWNRRVELRMKK